MCIYHDYLIKIERFAITCTIFFMPIIFIPKRFSISFFGNDAEYYFASIGLIALLAEYYFYKIRLNNKIKYYFYFLIVYVFVCNIINLYCYHFNGFLTLNLIPKLDWLVYKAQLRNINLNELLLIKIWLFFRLTKRALIDLLPILFFPFLIVHVYKDNFEEAFHKTRKTVMIIILLMCTYSLIELTWIKFDSKIAEDVLLTINPFFYDPQSGITWWPPLLWVNQVRSFFPEPAVFCMYSSMCFPFLWSYIFDKKEFLAVLLLFLFFSLMILSSGSRAGLVVFSFQLLMLLGICFVKKDKGLLKKVLIIILTVFLAFFINLFDFKNNRDFNDNLEQYYDNNVATIADTKKRSNGSRLGNTLGTLRVIKEHPVLGVGTGMSSVYVMNKLTDEELNVDELYVVTESIKKQGPFYIDYPKINFYTEFIVQYGFLGMLIFSVPYLLLFALLWKKRKILLTDMHFLMVLLALISLLIFMANTPVMLLAHSFMIGLILCKVSPYKYF